MSAQVKEHHTYIDGHKIAFREQGKGSPVILIHGIPTNNLMWREIIPQLAEAIPNAELVRIKDAGHWLIDEKPEEIGGHINRFLG